MTAGSLPPEFVVALADGRVTAVIDAARAAVAGVRADFGLRSGNEYYFLDYTLALVKAVDALDAARMPWRDCDCKDTRPRDPHCNCPHHDVDACTKCGNVLIRCQCCGAANAQCGETFCKDCTK